MKSDALSFSSSVERRDKEAYGSMVDLLRHRAAVQPDDVAYLFLKDGETEASRLTFAALDQHARAIAVYLREVVAQGSRVAIAYPPGLDFIAAFCGCLYAGVVAVPVYPPARLNDWARFEKIATDAGVDTVLTNTASLGGTRLASTAASLTQESRLRYLATESFSLARADEWHDPRLSTSSLAFLQYTSGSTGAPKGVIVSHGNLLHNQKIIRRGFGHDATTVFVGWLPLYHDMGLIGNVFQPLFLGIPSVLMAPAAFIVKPVRWLDAISTYRATTSGGPNFAYELCVRRVTEEQQAALDLSSWRVAFNGSEMVRDDTLTRFADKFTGNGFRRSSFLCCYGLAESTLFVTGDKACPDWSQVTLDAAALQLHQVRHADDATTEKLNLVGAGKPVELEVRIVDPATRETCAPDAVGEIWVRGDSVAQGYWNNAQVTEATFAAQLADGEIDGHGKGGFMRTGDLGFLRDGELFVTGRLKDLIIIRGRNYYSHDIETAVQASHPSLRIDGGAAFAIDVDGQECLVVVQEVNRTHSRNIDIDNVTGAVRTAMMMELGLPLHDLVLLRQGTVLKTSSGKIRRSACRDAYLNGKLAVLGAATESVAEVEDA